MKGIYQYRDLYTNDVVYIGRDSRIDMNIRHKQHLNPSMYNEQKEILSVDIKKLEKKVKNKCLEWRRIE